MLFNSIPFLAFFPIVFVAYWTLNRRAQNWFLIAASSVFYGWWDWRFLGLLWFTALAAFFAGWGISSAKNNRRRRLWLGVSLSAHLGLLVVFKYLDWGIQSLTEALRSLGFNVHGRTLGLILPIGISFYTFQALSYTIDVYRKKIEATGDLIDFSAFITFFPQLVAGPIERAPHMLPQFREARVFDSARAADGCRQILYGFLLKTVIADNCASVVDAVYGNIAGMSGGSLLLGTYAFALQIYGDFAGYSHIAIGCARLLGFDLNRNFAYPYFSRSPVEFWHRWHISLSTWFRDYVYLSLWRKRSSLIRQRLAVLATFFVSGLWHGASFRFAIWGVAHGLGVAGQWWPSRSRLDQPGGRRLWPRGRDALAMFLTFHWVCLLWVFFRARSVTEALSILGRIGSLLVAPSRATVLGGLPGGISLMVEPLVLGACMLSVEWLQRRKLHPFDIATLPGAARWAVYLAACLAIVALGRREVIPFIYFQF